jgi:hypothetical protein
MILFVDDEKQPEWFDLNRTNIHVATTFEDALKLIQKNVYDIIYMDHDLGDSCHDGSHLITEYGKAGKSIQKVCCISWNPLGVERIRLACKDFNIPFESHGMRIFDLFPVIDGQSH